MDLKRAHITGLGQCSWDCLSIIDHYPPADSKSEVREWREDGGGPVATALVALARLGMDCSFYGVRGDDEEGRKIALSLENEGINTAGLLTREKSRSQVAFIAVERSSARRTIFWRRPTGDALSQSELGDGFLENSSFLLVDGLMKEASLFAAKEARKRGIPVMLDAGTLREGMIELARECDYVVASETFAIALGWQEDKVHFRRILKEAGLGLTTITLGERGSLTFSNGKIIDVPAFKVNVVDTTGAGDVFHGAYIFALLQGWNLEKTLRFASACAALKCRSLGGREGMRFSSSSFCTCLAGRKSFSAS